MFLTSKAMQVLSLEVGCGCIKNSRHSMLLQRKRWPWKKIQGCYREERVRNIFLEPKHGNFLPTSTHPCNRCCKAAAQVWYPQLYSKMLEISLQCLFVTSLGSIIPQPSMSPISGGIICAITKPPTMSKMPLRPQRVPTVAHYCCLLSSLVSSITGCRDVYFEQCSSHPISQSILLEYQVLKNNSAIQNYLPLASPNGGHIFNMATQQMCP